MNDFEYIELFLDKFAKDVLMDWLLGGKYIEEMYMAKKLYLDHCTLLHSSQLNSLHGSTTYELLQEKYKLGCTCSLMLTDIGISDKAMAFKVFTDCPCCNNVSHITIGTFGDGKPVDSNKITKWEPIIPMLFDVTLEKR